MPQSRIFGGQVVAQCLMAANQTVASSLAAHSLHGYFLRAGDPSIPIEFDVDPIRDGRSFSTRRVVARQHGEAIFNTSISYHIDEEGVSYSFSMPEIAPPASEADDVFNSHGFATKAGHPNLMELYRIDRQRVTEYRAERQPPVGRSWFRAIGALSNDKAVHQAALVMISDYSLLSTVYYPHTSTNPFKDFMGASLDHVIWFHHQGKMDEWVLYDCDTLVRERQRIESRVYLVARWHAARVYRAGVINAAEAPLVDDTLQHFAATHPPPIVPINPQMMHRTVAG